ETVRGWRLTEAELALEGEHPAFGPVTLAQLLSTWVAHDLGHVAQTARVLAKQYREAAGPWREYLPVLTRWGGSAGARRHTAPAAAVEHVAGEGTRPCARGNDRGQRVACRPLRRGVPVPGSARMFPRARFAAHG